jgi:uncharacterized protein YdiU (UPF0061 family)
MRKMPLLQSRARAWQGWVARYCRQLAAEGLPPGVRAAMQDGANPFIIPRNHVLVGLAALAEEGDVEPLHRFGVTPSQEFVCKPLSALRAGWAEQHATVPFMDTLGHPCHAFPS